jgi:hypothetical protein
MPPKIAGPVVAGKKAKGETINAKLALVMKSGKVGAAPCVVHLHAETCFCIVPVMPFEPACW